MVNDAEIFGGMVVGIASRWGWGWLSRMIPQLGTSIFTSTYGQFRVDDVLNITTPLAISLVTKGGIQSVTRTAFYFAVAFELMEHLERLVFPPLGGGAGLTFRPRLTRMRAR